MTDDIEVMFSKPGLHPITAKQAAGTAKRLKASLTKTASNKATRINSEKGRDRLTARQSLVWLGIFDNMSRRPRNG